MTIWKTVGKAFAILLAASILPLAAAAQTTPAAKNAAKNAPAAAAPAAAPGSTAASTPDDTYIIGPGDVLEIDVLETTSYTAKPKVEADGTIQLPLLGNMRAADRTAKQLAMEIKAALTKGGFYKDPNLSVQVISFASRYATVLGQVGMPGLVPIDRPYHLSEIIARVGGVRDGAADYVIVRPARGPQRRLSIQTIATGDISGDPMVSPGDTIFAPQADVFYISGQVKSPGSYPLLPGMTLRQAISRGGGVTDLGSERGAKITRGGTTTKPGLDAKIQAGDVIVVGERLF